MERFRPGMSTEARVTLPSPGGPASFLAALVVWLFRLIRKLGWVYALGLGLAFALLALFADLAEDVLEGEFAALDHAILHALHARSSPALDWLALSLSTLGDVPATALITAAAMAALLALRRPLDAATLLIAIAGGGCLTLVLKQIFRQPRPALFESLAPETSYSFPSGHALMSVCLYGFLSMLILRLSPRAWPAALAVLLIPMGIMWSRLYLGVHWLTDVLAGSLAACFWLTVCLMLRRAAQRRLP